MSLIRSVYQMTSLFRIHTDDQDLVREQMFALERQIPWLYLNLLINAAALVYTHYSVAPHYLTIGVFSGMFILFVARMVVWFKPKTTAYTHEHGVKRLKSLWLTGTLIGIIYNCWGLQLIPYGNEFQQGHVAFFLSVTVISCLCSLVQFPALTLSLLAVSIVNSLVYFLIAGNKFQIAMACSFAIVILIVAFVSRILFMNFYDQIKAKRALSQSQEALSLLNKELTFHRDNLAQEVKRRTAQLEEALEAEKELNRLQNEFVSMVSHEFRTPLTIIDGAARRVELKFATLEPEEIVQRMKTVRVSVSRLSGLIERTLDASKLAAGKINLDITEFDLGELVRDIIFIQEDLHQEFDFELDLKDLPAKCLGDDRLMVNVINNLLSNAIKYSGDSRKVLIRGHEENGSVVLSIQDFGIGIPKKDLEKITDRFYRASNSTGIQGTGIGLNFVRMLIEQQNGSLSIESEEGKGTIVTICLPTETSMSERNSLTIHEAEAQSPGLIDPARMPKAS